MSATAITHIKNPLTIIGIFATIAEVSGTVVISFLAAPQQAVFVWFLIFFPTILVLCFFATLNWNQKVLYAPSDFNNEENFLKMNRYEASTQKEISTISIKEETKPKVRKPIAPKTELSKSEIEVMVISFESAGKFVKKLLESGYVGSIYNSPFTEQDIEPELEHESIWLGSEVSAMDAVKILQAAVTFYPHLKYISISSDNKSDPPERVHRQVFIGGSSSTAKQYGLKEIPNDKILGLSTSISKKDLHSFIREYY